MNLSAINLSIMNKEIIKKDLQDNNTKDVGILSVTLSRNMSDFTIPDTDLRKYGVTSLVDGDGKQTSLSEKEIRVLCALGFPLYKVMCDKETNSMIQKYVTQFNEYVSREAEKKEGRKGIRRQDTARFKPDPVILNVDLMWLSSILNYDSSVRGILGKKTGDGGIYPILQSLAQKRRVVRFTNTKGVTTIYKTPLIYLTGKEIIQIKNDNRNPIVNIEDLTEDTGEPNKRIKILRFEIEIGFGDVLLNNILTRFSCIPRELFQLWGRKGSGTETKLFNTLFFLLLSQFWMKYADCNNASKKAYETVNERHKGKRCETFNEEVQEEILLIENKPYIESLSKFKSRLSVKYDMNTTTRKRFFKDLESALKVLKDIGLVKRYGYGYSEDAEVVMRKEHGKDRYKPVIKAKETYLAVLLNPEYCKTKNLP